MTSIFSTTYLSLSRCPNQHNNFSALSHPAAGRVISGNNHGRLPDGRRYGHHSISTSRCRGRSESKL